MPFDQSFSTAEVEDSYERIKAVVDAELKALNGDTSKLIIGGFSQGCGMSI